MKKDYFLNGSGDSPDSKETGGVASSQITRRKFVKAAAAGALAFSIVPRHVLGGAGFIAPGDKITLAYVGCGTQGLKELLPLLSVPAFKVIAVCDSNRDAVGYKDWSRDGLRNEIRKALGKPDWTPGGDNAVPGGRENGREIVDAYYGNIRSGDKSKGCAAYSDYRELLEKEKDLDAVKIMTPDHLHGVFAMAALKKNKHVLMHKPLSNRLAEGKAVAEMARKSKRITHLIPWDSNGSMEQVMSWIKSGEIGTLKEVHNWTNRPVWPQFPTLPEAAPIPDGFNWDLWLGPEADRPYSPNYTHMVFRGWYDFGGGSMADMGHYSLWTVFNALQLSAPAIIEPNLSHFVGMGKYSPDFIKNDFSFPMACSVRFKYPAKGSRPAVDLCWYDGGMKPQIPEELIKNNEELPAEGMMFTGDKGKILTGFLIENPRLLSQKASEAKKNPSAGNSDKAVAALQLFANACKTGKQYPGSFAEAEYITEAVNLYAVSLRAGKLLKYDAASGQITNLSEATKYLSRNYRAGWDPATI
ncbi:MAG: oxidoreductase [Candidatus Nephrothrix sp. EaCA]|nr:MAG: oxidoreductase [Candidatus Nephrothrix sp. EaCA]